ncbi:MAG: hypothetical protein Q4C59_04855 [Lachnospiraceae bacterium]|nr:hypothetical protein [Lachnospiraceae bacterium]
MNLMNYHLYANTAALPQIMAEDTGAAELRNPVFYIRTEYNYGRISRLREKMTGKWHAFRNGYRGKQMDPRLSC